MGNALSEAEITRALERFRDAGMGGVEVSPIYGANGFEERFVPFLSPDWGAKLAHTLAEAKRLGLGVDLIAGTGWPYGGPWVTRQDAPRRFRWQTWAVASGAGVSGPLVSEAEPGAERLAVVAAGPGGERSDLSARVRKDGTLDWAAPSDGWRVGALFLGWTGQQVKRAAPGGAGSVVDHFAAGAVTRYMAAFDKTLAESLPPGAMVRCVFNDSYEVFGADATPGILDEFARRRGYDPRPHLFALLGGEDGDTARRVRADYRETVGDLMRESFVGTWRDWAHGKGAKVRFQAHGSPGNLLDLYAAADIPETEVFGPARLALGGMKPLAPQPPDYGREEEALVNGMASSAAHVAGRPLCSSESFTWLGEHGKVPLEHAKAEADLLFTLGINHIFFHGTPASPDDVAWPGWLFYATTHFGPSNPWWRDLPAFNAYLARCQSLLQDGVPDNDLLVYFPFPELLHGDAPGGGTLMQLAFHRTGEWLRGNLPDFARAANDLVRAGWAFDFVSDRQLIADVRPDAKGGLNATNGGAAWRALLVAGCRLLSPETLERVLALAHEGATVAFLGGLPEDVPGLADLEARRSRLRAARSTLGEGEPLDGGVRRHAFGKGRVLVGDNVRTLLAAANVGRETIADAGIEFSRRRSAGDGTPTYFLSNPGTKDFAGRVTLERSAPGYLVCDPMTGATGAVTSRPGGGGVYLSIPAGGSLLLRGLPGAPTSDAPRFPFTEPAGSAVPLSGSWHAEFIEGGPTLPTPRDLPKGPMDWTAADWPGEDKEARRAFSGTCRYTLTFDAPRGGESAAGWALELGRVCHSARVRLNDHKLGTLFARPYRLTLPPGALRPTGNVLELEVTNLMANRLADLERREGESWRPFLMVDIFYKPFTNAAAWEPLPSGLLGPVALVPLNGMGESG
jgi:hypothetical protein